MKKQTFIIIFIAIIFPFMNFARGNDSVEAVHQPVYKNVIKFNPTPMILWSAKNLTFSYERILTPRQSLSIELGFLAFNKFIEDSLIKMITTTSHEDWGINATVEYRFYLTKLNTRTIPAGLYIGPYLTYYGYHFKNGLDIFSSGSEADTTGTIQGDFWSFNLGVELGYQFVFWKRWTLDLVMVGPSVSYYGGKTELKGNFDASQVQDINEELYNKIVEKYPSFEFMTLDKTFEQTGKLDVLRLGFRYLVQIGFRF